MKIKATIKDNKFKTHTFEFESEKEMGEKINEIMKPLNVGEVILVEYTIEDSIIIMKAREGTCNGSMKTRKSET